MPHNRRLARPPRRRLEELDEQLGLTSEEGEFLGEAMGLTEVAEPPVGMPVMPRVRQPVADPLMPQANPTAPVLRGDYPRPVRPTYEPPGELSGWGKAGAIALGALGGLAGPGYGQRVASNIIDRPRVEAEQDYRRKLGDYESEMGIFTAAQDQETRMQQHRERMQLEREKAQAMQEYRDATVNRPYQISPGEALVTPEGTPIYEGEFKPERGFEVSEPRQVKVGNQIRTAFWDPNVQRLRDANTGEVLENAELYEEPDRPDRPFAPETMTVMVNGQPVLAYFDPNTRGLFDAQTGQVIQGAQPYAKSTVTPEDMARLEQWKVTELRRIEQSYAALDRAGDPYGLGLSGEQDPQAEERAQAKQRALQAVENSYQQQLHILQGGAAGPRRMSSPVPSRRQLNDPAGLFEDEDLP